MNKIQYGLQLESMLKKVIQTSHSEFLATALHI